jgi:hypothetical protein
MICLTAVPTCTARPLEVVPKKLPRLTEAKDQTVQTTDDKRKRKDFLLRVYLMLPRFLRVPWAYECLLNPSQFITEECDHTSVITLVICETLEAAGKQQFAVVGGGARPTRGNGRGTCPLQHEEARSNLWDRPARDPCRLVTL